MLRSKIENRESGVLLYGMTPPKQGHPAEKLLEIAERQKDRIRQLDIDGLVIYDIQDETARNASPRPFPFIHTEDPFSYSRDYLGDLNLPTIIYSGVGKFSADSFSKWLEEKTNALEFVVLVGAPSRQAVSGLTLSQAYQIKKSADDKILLGGVTIPERHLKSRDEHLRVISKTVSGCRFFISQCVYNVEIAKQFLKDYCEYLLDKGEAPVPIIFTLTPCGSLKTLQFMEWLGIQIPAWLKDELSGSDDMLERSVAACKEIIDELIDFAANLCVPVGFNIESVAIRKDEIEASHELVRYVGRKWNR